MKCKKLPSKLCSHKTTGRNQDIFYLGGGGSEGIRKGYKQQINTEFQQSVSKQEENVIDLRKATERF